MGTNDPILHGSSQGLDPQVIHGEEVALPVLEDVDVCIIGSGAGGGVCAKELAETGLSVVVLEVGPHFRRKDFRRDALSMMSTMYRDRGFTTTVGMPPVVLPLGKTIGGTTTINSGTCFRTPEKVLDSWGKDLKIEGCSVKEMKPWFERVEDVLQTGPVPEAVLGKNAQLFRRGVEALGLNGRPLVRNAPGCRGLGHCVFGCREDAKQATSISYLPLAIKAGARVYSNCRAEEILHDGYRVLGVRGTFVNPAAGRDTVPIKVKAKVVIVAAGTIHSASLLAANKLGKQSHQLGRNLHLHPATKCMALFDEEVRGWEGVPQGYYVDDLSDDGIMLEGIFMPPEYTALALPFWGRKHQKLMSQYSHLASFGLMVTDTSRGRLFFFGRQDPLMYYRMNRLDFRRCLRGIALMAEIFFAAGAKKVYLPFHSHPEISSPKEIANLFHWRLKAGDMDCAAFHPMGTARMGTDERDSVVDSWLELHGLNGLFVVDGSIFPSSLGVNPQESIMAFATRTSFHLAANRHRYFG